MSTQPAAHRAHDRAPKFIIDKRTGYLILVYYPDPQSPKRKYLSTMTADKIEAQQFVEHHRDRIGAQRRGHETIASKDQESFTIGQALDMVVADYLKNEYANADGVKGTSALIKLELGSVRCLALDFDRIESARDAWAKKGKKKGTVNRYIALVRRGFKLAAERKRIPHDLTFKLPRYDEKPFIRKGYVTRRELDLVIAHEPWAASRDLYEWSFWTGMRFGESTALKWEDYDEETFTIRLHGTDAKSGEGRALPLPPGPLRDLIERRLAGQRGPYIFQHAGAQIIDKDRWAWAWKRAGLPLRPVNPNLTKKKKGGSRPLPVKLFHDLRRTGVRNLVRALVAVKHPTPERTAMLISGHKTRAIFERYNIMDEFEAAPALVALTQYHATQTPPPAPPAAGVPARVVAITRQPRGSSTRAGRAAQTAPRVRSAS